MPEQDLIEILRGGLAASSSIERKEWAHQVVANDLNLEQFLPLLHRNDKTSQRFMWLLGDICELDPQRLEPCLPLLFSLRDEMPFPGMRRSVAKWLMLTQMPPSVEKQAVPQLLRWLASPNASIGCKSYSARTLFDLAKQGRIEKEDVRAILNEQAKHSNRSYAGRMEKLLERL